YQSIWLDRCKLNCITNVVCPKSGICGNDHYIIYTDLYIFDGDAFGAFFKEFFCFYKLIKNSGIELQQHSLFILEVLKSKKTFACRVEFNAVNLSSYEIFKFGPIGFIVDSSKNKQ